MSDGVGMTGVAELQELLLATDTLQEFLDEVAGPRRHGSVAGPVVWGDGAVGGRPLTIASSDGYANKLDQLQYRLAGHDTRCAPVARRPDRRPGPGGR
jgi:class 3 adenylate cyclase